MAASRVPHPELRVPGTRKVPAYIPLDLPPADVGRRRLAEAMRYMRFTIRSRQNAEADFLDSIGQEYDWKEELSQRWMPGNGAYSPRYHYKRDK